MWLPEDLYAPTSHLDTSQKSLRFKMRSLRTNRCLFPQRAGLLGQPVSETVIIINTEIHVVKPWWDESFYPKLGCKGRGLGSG